jgi:hypothetical protein
MHFGRQHYEQDAAQRSRVKHLCAVRHALRTLTLHVGFQVFTTAVRKGSVFWDSMSCSPQKVNQRFGGICRDHLQGLRKPRKKPA